jgi:hypothetical protein
MIDLVSKRKYKADAKVLKEIEKNIKECKEEDARATTALDEQKKMTKKLEAEWKIKKAKHEALGKGKTVRGDSSGKYYKLAIR